MARAARDGVHRRNQHSFTMARSSLLLTSFIITLDSIIYRPLSPNLDGVMPWGARSISRSLKIFSRFLSRILGIDGRWKSLGLYGMPVQVSSASLSSKVLKKSTRTKSTSMPPGDHLPPSLPSLP